MLWCQSWCQSDGTLVQRGDRVASPESGHLASLRGFTKGWSPLSCSLGVLTNTQQTNKPHFIHRLHSLKNWLLALPCQRTPRENQEGERQDTCRDEQCVFFYLFLSLKEVQMSPWRELFESVKTLVCRWMDGWDNLTMTKGKNSERTKCQIDIIRTQRASGSWNSVVFIRHNQSKTCSWEGWRLFTSVCFVCRAVVNTFSACSFDSTAHSPQPRHRPVLAFSYRDL